MLSPEEVQQARQQYGLDKTASPTGSNMGGAPVDHAARMARLRGLSSNSTPLSQFHAETPKEGSFGQDVSTALKNVGTGLKESFEMNKNNVDPTQGASLSNLGRTAQVGLHAVGSVAKGVTDVAGSAMNRSGLTDAIKKNVFGPFTQFIPENVKQSVEEGIGHLASGASGAFNAWKEKNPELGQAVQDAGNVVMAIPVVEGGAALTEAAPGFVKETLPAMAKDTGELISKTASNVVKKAGEATENVAPTVQPEVVKTGQKLGLDTSSPEFGNALERTKPVESVQKKLIERGKAKTKATGLLKREEYVPTETDVKIAHRMKDVLQKGMTPQEELDATANEVKNVAENKVKPLLEQHPIDLGSKPAGSGGYKGAVEEQLNAHVERPKMFASDATVERQFNEVGDRMKYYIQKNIDKALKEGRVPTQADVWAGKKEFTINLKKEFPKAFDKFAKDTAQSEAIDAWTSAVNSYQDAIEPAYAAHREEMSQLLEGGKRLSASQKAGLGKNAFERLLTKHPILKWVTKHPFLSTLGVGEIAHHL